MKNNPQKPEPIKSAADLAMERLKNAPPEEPSTDAQPSFPDSEVQDLKDKLLRARADLDNLQRLRARERDSSRLNAVASVIRDLLPVIDNLDRALENSKDDQGDLAKGIRMTRTLLAEALNRNNVSEIPSTGTFDAALHEAVSQVEDPTRPDHTIAQVVEKGYRIGDKVIRHSKVVVSVGGSQEMA